MAESLKEAQEKKSERKKESSSALAPKKSITHKDRLKLPALGSQASSRIANKRVKEYDPWLSRSTTPIKFTASVTDRHSTSHYTSTDEFARKDALSQLS